MVGTKADQPASLESPYKNSSSMPSLDGLGGNWPTFELDRKKMKKENHSEYSIEKSSSKWMKPALPRNIFC
jgi:hypothetical protein